MLTRATVRLSRETGEPADDSLNVLHLYHTNPLTLSNATAWGPIMATYWQSLSTWLSRNLSYSPNAHSISFAAVLTGTSGASDDVVQSPVFVHNFALTQTSPPPSLPYEVAAVLSHVGVIIGVPEESGPIRPAARRRGRVYLGPLGQNASGTSTPDIVAAFRTAATTNFKNMCEALANLSGNNQATLGIYSPTSDSFFSSRECHMDNDFDTVRSRGILSTARTVAIINPTFDHIGAVDGVGSD